MFLFNFDKTNNLKGFKKYLGEEDKLQRSVVEYLKWEYPEAIFTHVPNEGRRTPFERFKFKHLGSKAGVPDLMIFNTNCDFNGLAIELKVGRNKPTESQIQWLEWLKQCGWETYVLYNFDDVKSVLDLYFFKVKNI